jgi:hypothetical protein
MKTSKTTPILSAICVFVLAVLLAVSFTACGGGGSGSGGADTPADDTSGGGGDETPVTNAVTSVLIRTPSQELSQGASMKFEADVTGTGTYSTKVTWSLGGTPAVTGTSLTPAGFLVIAATQTGTLTVTATSAQDPANTALVYNTAKSASVTITVTQPAAYVKKISLDRSGSVKLTDKPVPEGYTGPTPLTVTVTGVGPTTSGALKIELGGENRTQFILSSPSLTSIDWHDTRDFTVTANAGLPKGIYRATVTVSPTDTTSDLAPVSFTIEFTVVDKEWKITLDKTTTHDFGEFDEGSITATALTVVITNTGNQAATGTMKRYPTASATTESADTDFTLSASTFSSLAVDGTTSFTITPNASVAPGGTVTKTYSSVVKVTIGTGSGTSYTASIPVTFRVRPAVYSIELNPPGNNGTKSFGELPLGYPDTETGKGGPALKVTIRNTGNRPTGALQITKTGDHAKFDITAPADLALTGGIAVGASLQDITILPKHDQAVTATWYTAVITVCNAAGNSNAFSSSFTVKFLVRNRTTEEEYDYQVWNQVMTVSGDPLVVTLGAIPLTQARLIYLFDQLAPSGPKYKIDLSACTGMTTWGNYGDQTAQETAAGAMSRITELILPTSVTNIAQSAFQVNSPEKVTGAEVLSIGSSAFMNSGVTAVSFPKATSIAENAFDACASLIKGDFSLLTTFGYRSFANCTALTSLRLKATPGNIQDKRIFESTAGSGNLTIYTESAAKKAEYVNAWGEKPANGTVIDIYGEYHKNIVISESTYTP